MSEKNYMHKIETHTKEDAEGNITETKKETLTKFQKSEEPDYIKLYTRMWAEFNNIPVAYRELFLQLALRMGYADENQMVHTSGTTSKNIMKTLGWQSRDMYQKGLRALVQCGAIKRIARGEYQINPSYAGKGEWKYNPRLERGGIEDLIATFNFKDKIVDTKIIWADDGKPTEFNKIYRRGMGVKAEHEMILKTQIIRPDPPITPENTPTSPENDFDRILQGRYWNGKIYGKNKVYLGKDEVLLSGAEVELLKTHSKYVPKA